MKPSKIEAFFASPSWGQKITKHLLFWLLFVFYNVATWGAYNEDIFQPIFSEFVYLPAKILMTYLTLYYLIPRFLLPQKYEAFFLNFLIALIFFGLWNRIVTYYIVYPRYFPEYVGSGFWKIKIFFEMTILVNIATLGATIKLLQYWYKNEQSRKQLAQEKAEAELKLLKSQIHPHFLFNTLNNLYALSLENSPHAPDMLLRLSSILNYMLYECNRPWVSLEQEIKHIDDYLSLEKLRYGEKLELSYEISGDIKAKEIAPLILLPFVENSFKHGASQTENQPWIHINISIDKELLHLQIENGIEEALGISTLEDMSYTQGIGLKNVKRRLELLYQDRYELNIHEEDSFLVSLKIKLNQSKL
ncbi:MAG: histidine kinase [Bacteroidota bacterium]